LCKLPIPVVIGNAAAVHSGQHGDVTARAAEVDCSRQTVYYHAAKVEQALHDADLPGPSREKLLEENAALHKEIDALRKENEELGQAYAQSVDFSEAKRQQFAACGASMGLSINQILMLMAILLPLSVDRPSRATVGRWIQAAAQRARRILSVLDKACHNLVLVVAIDEIFFHRKPVLMGVHPDSMAWIIGQRAKDRSANTWAQALAPWYRVMAAACDGGTGLKGGIDQIDEQRQQSLTNSPSIRPWKPIDRQLDVFHTRREGERAMQQRWKYAEKLWDYAAKLEREKAQFDRTGADGRRFPQSKVDKAWKKAIAEFEKVCREEKAWERACAALEVWREDGQLNERSWAEKEIEAAIKELTGKVWAKVCRQLRDVRTLTFLDRMHEELKKIEGDDERRATLVELWKLRREINKLAEEGDEQQLQQVLEILAEALQGRLGKDWQTQYEEVSRVLWRVLRASSAVECVNSVVRMHQARHRTLNQDLLDLKRLYWNCRRFIEGKRKDHCPYELLGLKLPCDDPWALLQLDPAQLEQILGIAG
jgi:hypothetical protein